MKRIGLYLFIIGITFIKAYGQEDSGPVNTGAANYLTIPVDARSHGRCRCGDFEGK